MVLLNDMQDDGCSAFYSGNSLGTHGPPLLHGAPKQSIESGVAASPSLGSELPRSIWSGRRFAPGLPLAEAPVCVRQPL